MMKLHYSMKTLKWVWEAISSHFPLLHLTGICFIDKFTPNFLKLLSLVFLYRRYILNRHLVN